MTRLLQYPALAEPLSQAGEAITCEKWRGERTEPQAAWHKAARFSLAAAVATTAFVHPGSNDAGAGAMQPAPDVSVVTFLAVVQYQALTQCPRPITAEAVTADKWFVRAAEPVRRADNRSYVSQGLLELDAGRRPEAVSLDRWRQPQSRPRLDAKRWQWLYPPFSQDAYALTRPETAQLDKWFVEASRPRFDLRRQQHAYPSLFLHEEPKEVSELVSADGWHQEAAQALLPPRATPHLCPSFTTGPRSLTQAEGSAPDKWFAETQRPRFEAPRQQHAHPPAFLDPLPAGGVTEEVTPDKWFKEAERPRFDVPRRQHEHQSFFPYPRPIGTPFSTISTTVRQTPVPHFDRKRTQYSHPSFFAEHAGMTRGETVTLDKWFREAERPRWDVPRDQHLYPPFTPESEPREVSEQVTADQWHQEPPVILRPKQAAPHLYPALALEAREGSQLVDTSWIYQDIHWPRRPAKYRSFDEVIDARWDAPAPPPEVSIGWFFEDVTAALLRACPRQLSLGGSFLTEVTPAVAKILATVSLQVQDVVASLPVAVSDVVATVPAQVTDAGGRAVQV